MNEQKLNYLRHNYTMRDLQSAIGELKDDEQNFIYGAYALANLLELMNDDKSFCNYVSYAIQNINKSLRTIHAVQKIKEKLDKR